MVPSGAGPGSVPLPIANQRSPTQPVSKGRRARLVATEQPRDRSSSPRQSTDRASCRLGLITALTQRARGPRLKRRPVLPAQLEKAAGGVRRALSDRPSRERQPTVSHACRDHPSVVSWPGCHVAKGAMPNRARSRPRERLVTCRMPFVMQPQRCSSDDLLDQSGRSRRVDQSVDHPAGCSAGHKRWTAPTSQAALS